MNIPIFEGVYTTAQPELRMAYPVNMLPIYDKNGVSDGYMRPGYGITHIADMPAEDKGGIRWNNHVYRVVGTNLYQTDGGITPISGLAHGDYASFDYSFDRLAIAIGGKLFYYDGAAVTQVTDPDLGTVIDVCWLGGYFVTTDGTSIVVTELLDPTQVNPLKYGSSEVDPDPIVAVRRVRNELFAINRHTIETFRNVGGDFFPFQRVEGASVSKGAVGTRAVATITDALVMVGSGRNEPPSVYIVAKTVATKIGTREIDQELASLSENELAAVWVETVQYHNDYYILVHLTEKTAVFNFTATEMVKKPVWSWLESNGRYRGRGFVWDGSHWQCADPVSYRLGYWDEAIGSHYGAEVMWELSTMMIYPENKGAIVHSLELVGIAGHEISDTSVYTQYSVDGEKWSQPYSIIVLLSTNRHKRLRWLRQGHINHWRIQRFRGDSMLNRPILRLDAELTPLMY